MSKKLGLGLSIAAMAVAIFGGSAVFAAGNDITYRGPNGVSPEVVPGEEPGLGLLEDYMVAYVAEQLDISAEEIQTQLDSGLTLAQILLDNGVEDIWTMTDAAHTYAVEQLNADGIAFPGWQNSSVGNAYQGGGLGMGSGMMGGRYGLTSH